MKPRRQGSRRPSSTPAPPSASTTHPPHTRVQEIGYLHGFRCSPEQCRDLCCRRYSLIPVDEATVARCACEAPSLLRHFKHLEDGHRMIVRDGKCSALSGRTCTIHADYGPSLQPEVCHFYPRRVLRLGDEIFVTPVLSCEVLLRRALSATADFSWHETDWERIPLDMPDLLTQRIPGASARDALALHGRIQGMVDARPGEEALAILLVLAGLLDGCATRLWPSILERHLEVLGRDVLLQLCAQAATDHALDGLLSLLGGLAWAPHHREFSHLARDARSLLVDRGIPWVRQATTDPAWQASVEPFLKRHLKARLSESLFPLSPWGTCLDEAWFLAACACVLRLGLLARQHEAGGTVNEEALMQEASAVEIWLHGRRQEIHDHARARGWLDVHRMTALVLGISQE